MQRPDLECEDIDECEPDRAPISHPSAAASPSAGSSSPGQVAAGSAGESTDTPTSTGSESSTSNTSETTADTTTTDTTTTEDPDTGTTEPAAVFGDGELQAPEVCDDGPQNGSYDACAADCAGPGESCGDGMQNGPKQCDDGDADDSDACLAGCLSATCGDGFVHAGVEQCDDMNADPTTPACRATGAAARSASSRKHARSS